MSDHAVWSFYAIYKRYLITDELLREKTESREYYGGSWCKNIGLSKNKNSWKYSPGVISIPMKDLRQMFIVGVSVTPKVSTVLSKY
jgi:hypothetical protein